MTAVGFLGMGCVTAFAEVEDIGRPETAFADGDAPQGLGLFRAGPMVAPEWRTLPPWTPRGDFTSVSRGGKFISSLGSDVGTPANDQNGVRPDYELNADYSSSTLDGGRFPATVRDFGSVEALIQGGSMLFGDDDQVAGFEFAASGYRSSGPSDFERSSEDPSWRKGSSYCSSDGSSASVVSCETIEDLGSFVTTNSGAGPSVGADQSSDPTGPNAPTSGGSLSAAQVSGLETIAARNTFAMTWPWGAIQGTVPSDCAACDAAPAVVGASTSDSSPSSIPLSGITVGTPLPPAVPEIPQWAMMLIGFGGFALLFRRRLRRSARLRQARGSRLDLEGQD